MLNTFKLLFFLSFIIFHNSLFANNIQITNISLKDKNAVDKYVYVRFDLSWEHSWRINTDAQNWDAAWVFIKFRAGNGNWQHATLSAIISDHRSVSGAYIETTSDQKGVFIYRDTVGSGNNNWQGIELKWFYGQDGLPDDAQELEVKVFGIEMVYVPQGDFYVGDGTSVGHFWDASANSSTPALISTSPVLLRTDNAQFDDDQITNTGILVDGDEGIDTNGVAAIDNPDFPTGYKAFYCMKYELTNQQYADFLNTISRDQQNTRTYFDISGTEVFHPYPMNHVNTPSSRNSVRYIIDANNPQGPVIFFPDLNQNGVPGDPDDGGNIVICNVGWADGAAYADWAGLRPMTELEFEKACRGPEYPIANEFAWHTTLAYGDANTEYIFANPDTIGTENSYPVNPGTGQYGNAEYEYTTGHQTEHNAPLRAGIFATDSSNRVNSGASYYGIMELSGSMTERIVTFGNANGRKFRGTHGDGQLNNLGNADNTDWPGIVSGEESDGVKSKNGSGLKGGDWNDAISWLHVSYRGFASEDPYSPLGIGNIGSGFRCVRSVGQ